jgi:PAS domain S-box-containing protein
MAGGGDELAATRAAASRVSLRELYLLSEALARAADLKEICELATSGVKKAVGSDRAAILLRDTEGVMRFQAWLGLSEDYRHAVEGHSPWNPDNPDPEPVLVGDVTTEPSLTALLPRVVAEGIASVAFIPILREGVLAGKFMLYFDHRHAFSAEEMEIAGAIANHVGFALERKQGLQRLVDERQLFVEGPVVVIKWRAAPDWPVEFVSANVHGLLGHDSAALEEGVVRFEDVIAPTDLDRVRAEIRRHLSSGAEHFAQEYRIRRADGAIRWLSDYTRIVRDPAGQATHFHAYLQDVTATREAEAALRELTATLESRVARRTAELEAAMRELGAFAYSVSHDLRTPLRAIDGFSMLLREAVGKHLEPDTEDMFSRIRGATQRMGGLIDELLGLTRISQQAISRRPVDLSAMAREIAARLGERAPDRVVEWHIEEGLAALVDPPLARVLLEHLLGNAWKFTAERPVARIEFTAEPETHPTRFCVSDNGAGFDMQYAANLFNPFQRLHSPEQFPGAGVGLASVLRIVRRHGGSIEARGVPDAGASFHFTLAAPLEQG